MWLVVRVPPPRCRRSVPVRGVRQAGGRKPRRDLAPIPLAALTLAADRRYFRSISRSILTSTARSVRSSSQSISSSAKARLCERGMQRSRP